MTAIAQPTASNAPGLKLFEDLIENCAEQLRSDLVSWLAGMAISPRDQSSSFPCSAEWDNKEKGLVIEIKTRQGELLEGLVVGVEYDRCYMLPDNLAVNWFNKATASAKFKRIESNDGDRIVWRAILRLPKNAKIMKFYTSGI